VFAEVPLAAAGHMVSALMHFSSQVAGPASRGSKLVVRRAKLTKSDHILLEGATRCEFIKAFLVIHDLADRFSPGIHFGPPFKMYWTGSMYVIIFCHFYNTLTQTQWWESWRNDY
jgi:hypothetical protein